MRTLRGGHDATGLAFGIAAASFNERHVQRLVEGALDTLRRQGARDEDLRLAWVPGSLELPLAARWLARGATDGRAPAAVLAFGVILRGETEHFRLVADQCARGLLEVALGTDVPVLNGVLACHDVGQVEARLGGPVGHTGVSTALAAIAMARLREQVS